MITRRGLLLAWAAPETKKPLRGIFPIAQTPFTAKDELDLDALVRQLVFLERGGVPGCVWPQLASEWSTLRAEERRAGVEALLKARRKPAVVIGVQAPAVEEAVAHAEHAARHGADALIALPPPGQPSPEAMLAYYQRIGQATPLPLFVQAVGNLSVEFILAMSRAVPTLEWIKDEAGEPLMRVGPLREGSRDRLKVFTGAHGRTLIDEMARGTAGSMPAASIADLYTQVWDHWHAGRQAKALDLMGLVLLFVTEMQVYGIASLKYILELRGVFPNHAVRGQEKVALDAKGREVLARLVEHARPHFKSH